MIDLLVNQSDTALVSRALAESMKDNPFVKKLIPEESYEPPKPTLKDKSFLKKESEKKTAEQATTSLDNKPEPSALKDNPFVKMSQDAKKKVDKDDTNSSKINTLKGMWN